MKNKGDLSSTTFRNKSGAGFTMIEILVVMGITAILVSVGTYWGTGAYKRVALNSERDIVVSLLTKARGRSMNNIGQSEHGVRFVPGEYIVLADEDGDGDLDIVETIESSPGIIVDASDVGNEVIFDQLSGRTSSTGDIQLDGGGTRIITINDEGAIIW